MYQNMDCVVWGNPQFLYSTKYDIYNSANEKIGNPVYVTGSIHKIGVMVPYGGYIDIQMDSTHGLGITLANNTSALFYEIQFGTSAKIKVVRDYYTILRIKTDTQSDPQTV